MIYPIGEKGHAYGEHMQTIWNGILGKIKLYPLGQGISNVRIHTPFPISDMDIVFNTDKMAQDYRISLTDSKTKTIYPCDNYTISSNQDKVHIQVNMIDIPVKPWDEFDPQLYELVIKDGNKELYKNRIGFRSLKRTGNRLVINDKPLFLRGNLDNCHFPLTGYPSTKTEDWFRIFDILKKIGCNNIRFHSYCPPKAAFEAADELGIYLAPEAGVWIDEWMPGNPIGLGKGNDTLDNFIKEELIRIQSEYGVHPSFCMLGIGNELGNSDFDEMSNWLEEIRDSSRLYTASTARTVSKSDDYYVTHHYPGIGNVRQQIYPNTDWDYENLYDQTEVPTVAHEIGQWPVYPDWNEIKKYTGVLEPDNLKMLRDQAIRNNVYTYNQEYHFASGMQSRLLYKDEIESFLRTPSCQGIHLLGIQDYSGQGEALVGFLDSFYDEKGTWRISDVQGCFGPIVTLARFPKYGWKTDELFQAALSVRNMKQNLDQVRIRYQFRNSRNTIIKEGYTPFTNSPQGELTLCGNAQLNLSILNNDRITLSSWLVDTQGNHCSAVNSWNFWVFKEIDDTLSYADVFITADLVKAIDALRAGKKVILDASRLGAPDKVVSADWGAVYWSTTWFNDQHLKTLGLWLEKKHPIFKDLSCDGFGDWIWWFICKGGRAFNLSSLPFSLKPIAMPVPDFHYNICLGSIFEVNALQGKLLVSGYALDGERIEQKVLKNAMIEYVHSENFSPATELSESLLRTILENNVVHNRSESDSVLLKINCAANLIESDQQTKWEKKFDACQNKLNTDYELENMQVYKQNSQTYWVAKRNAKIIIYSHTSNPGYVYITFRQQENNTCTGDVDGRYFSLNKEAHDSFQKKIPVDRENCLDGRLVISIESENGCFIEEVRFESN